MTTFGLATLVSLLRTLSSTSRVISSSLDDYYDDAPHVGSSKQDFVWDEVLEAKYSTTHQRIRGQFSLILNDSDETHSNNNDFQHKGILRTSSEKHGKWMKIRWMRPNTELMVAGETVHKAGTNYSKYVEDTRLVIDVNHTILFPSMEKTRMKGETDNNHLCHVLRLVTGNINLGMTPKKGIPPVDLNVAADCNFLNKKFNGQGDTILALYRLRMTTALAKVNFQFRCTENKGGSNSSNDYMKEKSRKLRWVFPWFASHQSSSDDIDPWPYRGDAPTQDQLCGDETSNELIPIEKMADQIRDDVRKMALQLIGNHKKDPKRIHPYIPLDVEPWIPDIDIDDVIIHFPCYSDLNDLGAGKTIRRSPVGIMQFNEYTKHIRKNVKKIGIIREISGETRQNSNEDVCYRASTLLYEYLESFYTDHEVSISIYENDSLPLQYARIAMARQSFSSFSVFGMIPIIGTFGEGYFQPSRSDTHASTALGKLGNQNYIIQNIVSGNYEGFENINLMSGNVLSSEKIDTMSFNEISNWLLGDGTPKYVIWNEDAYKYIQTEETKFEVEDAIILVGDEEGYISENGQLVVDVDEKYLFWDDGQEKLCNLLQNMTFAVSLDEKNRSNIPPTVLNATMDCVYHNKHIQGFGQGNWVTAVYAARMAAFLAGVDFKFQCTDKQTSKMSLLLPWFDKYQAAQQSNRTTWPHGGDRPTKKEACPLKYPFLRIDKMAYEIQDDLQKMAVSLVGTRDSIRRHPDVPVDAAPLIPDVVLDDVALHFRCGDVLGGSRRNDFGMIRFDEYKKWIPKNTESIGILTQPFEKDRNRGQDSGKVENCRVVVHALVDYLQEFAPNAKISIHNGVNETLPLAYARLVMANHSITSLSSFGIFPVIGTFGQGYFQKGNRGVNPFAAYVPNILPNIHQMEADVRETGQMKDQSIENLVEWFVNDTSTR